MNDTTTQSTIMIHGIARPMFPIKSIDSITEPEVNAGIYALICLKTGSMYVGSSGNIANRVRSHFTQLNQNQHPNHLIQNQFNGFPNDWVWAFLEPIADLNRQAIYRREHGYIKSGLFDLNIAPTAWSKKRNTKKR